MFRSEYQFRHTENEEASLTEGIFQSSLRVGDLWKRARSSVPCPTFNRW